MLKAYDLFLPEQGKCKCWIRRAEAQDNDSLPINWLNFMLHCRLGHLHIVETNTTEGTTKAAPCQLSAGTECRQLQLIDYIDEWISNKTPTQRGVWMRYRVCIPSACWGLTLSLHFHLHLRTYISIHLCAMLWLQYARLVNLFLSSCLLNKFLVKCLRSISFSVTFPACHAPSMSMSMSHIDCHSSVV